MGTQPPSQTACVMRRRWWELEAVAMFAGSKKFKRRRSLWLVFLLLACCWLGSFGLKKAAESTRIQDLYSQKEENVSFMLVTAESPRPCKTSLGTHLLMKSFKNKVDYCRSKGCRVWYSLETWRSGFTGTWARYPLLKRLMTTNPNVGWFMWMDGDAIFTNMSFSLPLEDYDRRKKHFVVPGNPDKVYGKDPDWVGLNAGVFLLKNSVWSLSFLDKWIEMGKPENAAQSKARVNQELPNRPQEWGAEDQSALVYLLRHLPLDEREQMTYLEQRYTLHGYWKLIVESLESSGEKPFITHFCGCSFCSIHDPMSPCVKGFKRAYHFADDQILRRAGIRHSHLNTSAVQEI